MSKTNDEEPDATRNSNGESSIYKGADGSWHGRVTMGTKDDGTPDRRHRRGKIRAEVVKKVRALEKQRDQGTAPKVGQRYRVSAWLTYWVETSRARRTSPRTRIPATR